MPTVGMQIVHQDPKRWACGRRSTASPSSVSTVRLTCTGRVLVGPCFIIYEREQATSCTAPGRRLWDHAALFAPESMPHIRPRESVEPCCVEGASHTTEAHTITSTLETFLGGGTMLLHPLLSLVLLISYRDARITSNRESMDLLPENNMKTFSQITRILSLWPACEAARNGREGRRDAGK